MNYRDVDYGELKGSLERDGFVCIEGFLDGDSVEELEREVERYIEEIIPTMPRTEVFYENKDDAASLKQIQRMYRLDTFFRQMFSESPIRTLAEKLLDDGVVPTNLQYFDKPPLIGQPTPPHQDGYYFMLEPCEALTMWLALDDVDEENGCVRYVRGSHSEPMRTHGRTKTLGFSQGIIDYGLESDREREVAFPANPGDLLVHHARTIHRADGNMSDSRHRRALGFIYFAERARVDEGRKAAYQEELSKNLIEKGKL